MSREEKFEAHVPRVLEKKKASSFFDGFKAGPKYKATIDSETARQQVGNETPPS
jgi:hypothetical protein